MNLFTTIPIASSHYFLIINPAEHDLSAQTQRKASSCFSSADNQNEHVHFGAQKPHQIPFKICAFKHQCTCKSVKNTVYIPKYNVFLQVYHI